MTSCICVGPKRAGKTHLLKALQDPQSIDETSYSMPTMGTSIYHIKFPANLPSLDKMKHVQPPSSLSEATKDTQSPDNAVKDVKRVKPRNPKKSIQILEIGGSMAPLWRQYYNDVEKIIYVVDTSNLCQISAAGVLFYSLLVEPRLQKVKILLVLTKMDYAYRQMRNEALLMLQMSKLQKEIRQQVTIVEASAVSKIGLDSIYQWLQLA